MKKRTQVIFYFFIGVLALPILVLFLKLFSELWSLCIPQWISWIIWEKTLFSDAIFAITGLIILGYTFFTWRTIVELRRGQNLNTLANLTKYYDAIRKTRSKVFTDKEVTNEDRTRLSNFLDGFAHITFKLPDEDKGLVIERWSETLIRCWIRLSKFVNAKRPHSMGRDYCFFEWLAGMSFDYHAKSFEREKIHFYDFEGDRFRSTEIWEYYEEAGERGFCLTEKAGNKTDRSEKVIFLAPQQIYDEHIKKWEPIKYRKEVKPKNKSRQGQGGERGTYDSKTVR